MCPALYIFRPQAFENTTHRGKVLDPKPQDIKLYTHSSIKPIKILTHHGLKQFFAKYSLKAPGVQIRWNICKFCIIYWKKVFLWFWFFNSVLLFDEKKLQDFCRKFFNFLGFLSANHSVLKIWHPEKLSRTLRVCELLILKINWIFFLTHSLPVAFMWHKSDWN